MYIGNLPVDCPCTLFARNEQGQSMRFETSVIDIVNNTSVKLTAYRHNGKLVNFNNAQCILEAVADNRFYLFAINPVVLVRDKTEPHYLITCAKEGKSKNRRGAVRIPMNGTVSLRVGTKAIADAQLYDLSYTGIAISVPKGQTFTLGDSVAASFRYKQWDEKPYQVKGKIARIEILEQGRFDRIGIEFIGVYKDIDKLIAEVQRDRASLHRQELLKKRF